MKNHLIIFQKILDGNLICHFHWPNLTYLIFKKRSLVQILNNKNLKIILICHQNFINLCWRNTHWHYTRPHLEINKSISKLTRGILTSFRFGGLSPIKTAESESHDALSKYVFVLSFLFLNRIGSSIPQNDRLGEWISGKKVFCDPTHMTDFVTS